MTARYYVKQFLPRSVLSLSRNTLNFLRMMLNYRTAKQLVADFEKQDTPALGSKPRPGFSRGVDFYGREQLIRSIALTMAQFKAVHGAFPDFAAPRTINEKIVWAKFFAEFKIPESGNKLLTSYFIPKSLKDRISCPTIVWHSPTARLPENDEIPAGPYYLKANHGSGMVRRVSYPLSEKDKHQLERLAASWLRDPYGFAHGEWWYCCFQKEILLEVDVCANRASTAWMFHVFAGDVALVSCYTKDLETGKDRAAWLDPDFHGPLNHATKLPVLRPEELNLSDSTKRDLQFFAKEIGKNFSYVRVDFLIGKSGSIFLNEITLSPNNGIMRWPPEIDTNLGNKWTFSPTFAHDVIKIGYPS